MPSTCNPFVCRSVCPVCSLGCRRVDQSVRFSLPRGRQPNAAVSVRRGWSAVVPRVQRQRSVHRPSSRPARSLARSFVSPCSDVSDTNIFVGACISPPGPAQPACLHLLSYRAPRVLFHFHLDRRRRRRRRCRRAGPCRPLTGSRINRASSICWSWQLGEAAY